MYKVIMLETVFGSEDGKVTNAYKEGEEYEVGEALYKSFVEMGAVKLADSKLDTISEPIEESDEIEYSEGVELEVTAVKRRGRPRKESVE